MIHRIYSDGMMQTLKITSITVAERHFKEHPSAPDPRPYYVAVRHQGDKQPIALGSFASVDEAEDYRAQIREYIAANS